MPISRPTCLTFMGAGGNGVGEIMYSWPARSRPSQTAIMKTLGNRLPQGVHV